MQEIAFEYVVCKMAYFLSRPQYVKNNDQLWDSYKFQLIEMSNPGKAKH